MNLLEFLSEQGVEYKTEGHEHCRSGWVNCDCPQCSGGWRHWRLGIHLGSLGSSCWSCGRINTSWALSQLTGLSYGEVKELLPRLRSNLPQEEKVQGKLVIPPGVGPLLPAHKKYLKKRGFDPEELERLWGVRGIGLASRLAWRLFIPVILHGKIRSWTTRSIGDSPERRYVNARPEEESIPLKDMLLGEDLCRHCVVVTEGPLDAMRVGPGGVCTFGLNYTNAQINRIIKYPVRVILFDSDEEAQQRAERLRRDISVFHGETYRVEMESAKDPGGADPQEIQELREKFGLS